MKQQQATSIAVVAEMLPDICSFEMNCFYMVYWAQKPNLPKTGYEFRNCKKEHRIVNVMWKSQKKLMELILRDDFEMKSFEKRNESARTAECRRWPNYSNYSEFYVFFFKPIALTKFTLKYNLFNSNEECALF